MQKLIEDSCVQYMNTIELSILDLSDPKYMESMRIKIIDNLKSSEKEYIKRLHEEFNNKISLEITLINYYDKLLQRSPVYIKIWHFKLNLYIQEFNDYNKICNSEIFKFDHETLKVSTLDDFVKKIEKMHVSTLKLILRFCTHVISDF
jgi:hypothetical protein